MSLPECFGIALFITTVAILVSAALHLDLRVDEYLARRRTRNIRRRHDRLMRQLRGHR